jgi:hypothetical protein
MEEEVESHPANEQSNRWLTRTKVNWYESVERFGMKK